MPKGRRKEIQPVPSRKLVIEIECDNAAFGVTADECESELRQVLGSLCARIAPDHGPRFKYDLTDSNGNWVGEARWT